jgi:hypothetical protein
MLAYEAGRVWKNDFDNWLAGFARSSSKCTMKRIAKSNRCERIAFILLACTLLVSGCSGHGPTATYGSRMIRVTMRESAIDGKSGVLQLENISHHSVDHVHVRGKNLDNGQSFRHTVGSLDQGEKVELGILEIGWTFIPNEEITVLTLKPGQAPLGNIAPRELLKFFYIDVYRTYKAESGVIGVKHIRGDPID